MGRWVRDKVESQSRFFKTLLRSDLSVQVAMILLRLNAILSMGYLARVVPPAVLGAHAVHFENLVAQAACEKLSLPLPQTM